MVGLDAVEKFQAIHARHSAIEQNQIESIRFRIKNGPRFDAIPGEFGIEPFTAQMRIEQRSIELIVFDDQDMGLLSHDGMPAMIKQKGWRVDRVYGKWELAQSSLTSNGVTFFTDRVAAAVTVRFERAHSVVRGAHSDPSVGTAVQPLLPTPIR